MIAVKAQYLARKHNVVIWGVVVPLKHNDAKSIASGGSFCSHEGMATVFKELGVNIDDFCGDIAVGFGCVHSTRLFSVTYSCPALNTWPIGSEATGPRKR